MTPSEVFFLKNNLKKCQIYEFLYVILVNVLIGFAISGFFKKSGHGI